VKKPSPRLLAICWTAKSSSALLPPYKSMVTAPDASAQVMVNGTPIWRANAVFVNTMAIALCTLNSSTRSGDQSASRGSPIMASSGS